MWQIKTWKLTDHDKMLRWIEKNKSRIEYQEIFINNGYGIEFRWLRVIL